jgi:sporulation protein YlmC with PRC-barrel domain
VSRREVSLTDLLGRKVRDVDGRVVGRLEELLAEIELRETGSDYVVREYHVGTYGLFEALAGGAFAQRLLRRLGRLTGYRRYRIPWSWLDISQPSHPRVMRRKEELMEG